MTSTTLTLSIEDIQKLRSGLNALADDNETPEEAAQLERLYGRLNKAAGRLGYTFQQ